MIKLLLKNIKSKPGIWTECSGVPQISQMAWFYFFPLFKGFKMLHCASLLLCWPFPIRRHTNMLDLTNRLELRVIEGFKAVLLSYHKSSKTLTTEHSKILCPRGRLRFLHKAVYRLTFQKRRCWCLNPSAKERACYSGDSPNHDHQTSWS